MHDPRNGGKYNDGASGCYPPDSTAPLHRGIVSYRGKLEEPSATHEENLILQALLCNDAGGTTVGEDPVPRRAYVKNPLQCRRARGEGLQADDGQYARDDPKRRVSHSTSCRMSDHTVILPRGSSGTWEPHAYGSRMMLFCLYMSPRALSRSWHISGS